MFNGPFYFQQFRIKFQSIWIEESVKILRINEFLKEKNELADIRSEFENIQIKSDEIDEEPSSIEIGPFQIQLGKSNLTSTSFTHIYGLRLSIHSAIFFLLHFSPVRLFFFFKSIKIFKMNKLSTENTFKTNKLPSLF